MTLISRFSRNIETTRDFITLVEPLIEQHGKKQISDNIEHFAPLLILYESMLMEDEHKIDVAMLARAKKVVKIKVSDDKKSFAFKDYTSYKNFVKARDKLELISGRSKHLYEVSLISLISSVEWFLSQILHSHFKNYPRLVTANSQKPFTYSDLEKFNTLDDAKQFLIDQKVDEIIRSDFKSWIDFLKMTLKLDLSFCELSLNFAEEVFQRRNLLVHNNGIVNNIYLNKTSSEVLQKFKLKKGSVVTIDNKYLQDSINMLESIFLCIGSIMWRKQLKEDGEISVYFETINKLAYNHMKEGRFEISEKVYFFLESDKEISIHDELMAKVNKWISIKQQGRFNEIKQDIVDSDFSAFEDKYVMARHILLDEYSNAIAILKVMLKAKKISLDELKDWPLFNTLRDNAEFCTLVQDKKVVSTKKKAVSTKSKSKSKSSGTKLLEGKMRKGKRAVAKGNMPKLKVRVSSK